MVDENSCLVLLPALITVCLNYESKLTKPLCGERTRCGVIVIRWTSHYCESPHPRDWIIMPDNSTRSSSQLRIKEHIT